VVLVVIVALVANPAAKEGMIGKEDTELEDCSWSRSSEDGVLQMVECCIMVKENNRED
jgi:hypothetical protein